MTRTCCWLLFALVCQLLSTCYDSDLFAKWQRCLNLWPHQTLVYYCHVLIKINNIKSILLTDGWTRRSFFLDDGANIFGAIGSDIICIGSTLSEETAHSTVYQHLSQQSSCIRTAQRSLRWRCTVGWPVSSESVWSRALQSANCRSSITGQLRRRSQIKMQFSQLHFNHPNILRTSDELSQFFSGVYHPQDTRDEKVSSRTSWGVIDPRKKFDRESSSKVCKMLRCLKRNYENCIFIREYL